MKLLKIFLASFLFLSSRAQMISLPVKNHQVGRYGNFEDIVLTTLEDQQYAAPIFFGTPLQGDIQSEFVPYMMSKHISVTSLNCTTCGT